MLSVEVNLSKINFTFDLRCAGEKGKKAIEFPLDEFHRENRNIFSPSSSHNLAINISSKMRSESGKHFGKHFAFVKKETGGKHVKCASLNDEKFPAENQITLNK